MSIKLIACDLDGTLLMDDHVHVSSRNLCALKEASAKGIKIVVASGRTYDILKDILVQIDKVDYALISNGAAAIDLSSGEWIFQECMEPELWMRIYRLLKNNGATFETYHQGHSYVENSFDDAWKNEGIPREFLEDLKAHMCFVDSVEETLKGKLVEKMCAIYTPQPYIQTQYETLASMKEISISTSIPGNVEINRTGTHKGRGLMLLCQRLGIAAEEVMAFGDANNDLEMLSWAKYSFAMENATKEAKAAAYGVTSGNMEDGVAVKVEELVLNQ